MAEWYEGDAGRIRQILLNLVSNAVKFTVPGRGRPVCTSGRAVGGPVDVRLAVRDTGIGIAADRQKVIFESFTQADGSISRRYGGTGLGLSICRRLAELMGGKIGLESEPGRGSEFWLELNLPEQCERDHGMQPDSCLLHGHRILLAIGNSVSRSVLKAQVESWGCRTAEAGDAADVFSLLRFASVADPFAVVLIDQQLVVESAGLIEEIMTNPRTAGVKIVLAQDGVSRIAEKTISLISAITKPIRQSSLYNMLVDLFALGSMKATEAIVAADSTTRAPVPGGMRVLVAEDNPTNQKVAMRMLERLGCHADAVADGCEALAMLARINYNLVLMDVQMPEMDGYVATAEIRRREKANGIHLPVIAMTAHAMRGDRERCLAAGMDDYLSKPVTHQRLAEMLERWCLPSREDEAAANHDASAKKRQLKKFRFERLHEISAGDPACECELLRTFLDDAASGLARIRAALDESDAACVAKEAHSLLGAAVPSVPTRWRICALGWRGWRSTLRLPAALQMLADFGPEYDRTP